MEEPEVKNLTFEGLQTFMDGRHEGDYLLIDVRQPDEYRAGHIPGAFFLPLPVLETKLFELPEERDLVFYCRSGARSMAAAVLAVEAEVTARDVYNLEGGILAWQGKRLSDFPRVQVFDKAGGLPDLLHTAMDLEKGAWRFYRAAMERVSETPLAPALRKLAEAETAHARAVYQKWAPTQPSPEPFETLFEQLTGEILEGGEPLQDAIERMDRFEGEPCMNIIELALHIEYSAYDLYRTVADQTEDGRSRSAFLSIAQAEKGHMRMLTRGVARCEGTA